MTFTLKLCCYFNLYLVIDIFDMQNRAKIENWQFSTCFYVWIFPKGKNSVLGLILSADHDGEVSFMIHSFISVNYRKRQRN